MEANQQPTTQNTLTNVELNFTAPLTILETSLVSPGTNADEATPCKNHLHVRGVAINETTSRNGVTYTSANLQPAAESLRNKPILKDHNNTVDSIVGRTTEEVHFSPHNKSITFEGHIMDKKTQEMIKDGRINNVSVGAIANLVKIESESGGEPIVEATDIEFVELSLTPVPGVKAATITQAIAESYNKIQGNQPKTLLQGNKPTIKEDMKMTETKEDISKLKESLTVKENKLAEDIKAFEEQKRQDVMTKVTAFGNYTAEELKVFNEEQLTVLLTKETNNAKEVAEAKAQADKATSKDVVKETPQPKSKVENSTESKEPMIYGEQLANGRIGITSESQNKGRYGYRVW